METLYNMLNYLLDDQEIVVLEILENGEDKEVFIGKQRDYDNNDFTILSLESCYYDNEHYIQINVI